ncbi:IS110 family RNA-guided transposase [Tessaracoccus caeni]|uniref:IS110 family transposase n=1 Tax=Tessaracoccus caeni TaxID=3031239 RepID=UPI0023DC28C0|nr:IS110 family transposase [Tessaracoccus caeni]MDF1490413.1 IS110 family transposase [Tessaracoccus caeni]
MTIVADAYRFVIGIDTHAKTHHWAIIESRTGGVIDNREFPTTPAGINRAITWIRRRTHQATTNTVLVSMEGTGSYGTKAARALLEAGYRVTDAPSPKRPRGTGKNDAIDAITAARNILHKHSDHLADMRSSDTSKLFQVLLTARDSMTRERTRHINALGALLRTQELDLDARHKPGATKIRQVASWRPRATDSPLQAAARAEAIRLAKRIRELDTQITDNTKNLRQAVQHTMPSLLALSGVGPVNAAIVLCAWSHPGRVRNDAAFAKLAGACPLEVSSGNRKNHRLNRTGDRQLNKALHIIAKTRLQHDPTTQAYLARRITSGSDLPRARRCLKRYIARELFKHLENHH